MIVDVQSFKMVGKINLKVNKEVMLYFEIVKLIVDLVTDRIVEVEGVVVVS